VTVFQCVANNHCCDCKKTECGKHVGGPDSVRESRKPQLGQENDYHSRLLAKSLMIPRRRSSGSESRDVHPDWVEPGPVHSAACQLCLGRGSLL
jgi:hypothetical protein